MTSKDWATLTLSILALAVSGFTAYFNLLRQVDDLRVTITADLGEYIKDDELVVTSATGLLLFFANLGTRQAGIESVTVNVSLLDEKHKDLYCRFSEPLSIEPVVLKAGEIAVVKGTLTRSIEAKFCDSVKNVEKFVASSFVSYTIITPDTYLPSPVPTEIANIIVEKNTKEKTYYDMTWQKVAQVYYKWRTIFW